MLLKIPPQAETNRQSSKKEKKVFQKICLSNNTNIILAPLSAIVVDFFHLCHWLLWVAVHYCNEVKLLCTIQC